MARIVLADDGVAFDGRSLDGQPAGGAETAFVRLAEALAQSGHEVTAFANAAARIVHKNVAWAPVGDGLPQSADLYVANRSPHLLANVPEAAQKFFWLHNDPSYLLKPRHLVPLLRHWPSLVFVSHAQAAAASPVLPARKRHVIALGLDDLFRSAAERAPPAPLALYAANPLRGLAMLAPLWTDAIAPGLPNARLQIHTGLGLYGAPAKPRTQAAMQAAIDAARAACGPQFMLGDLVDRAQMSATLLGARVYLYPGDATETFCLSVAEAQAMGVPCVVMARGALPERIVHGTTGFVVQTEADFADAARRLLVDDALWQAQHRACLATQRGRGWSDMAADFAQKAGL
jgi:glycosyltransferase involved in cell wall biosynthesis